jgi:hypothetical protein
LAALGGVLLLAVVAVALLWQNELGPFSVNNPTSFQVFASQIGAAYEAGGKLEEQLGSTDPTDHEAELAALQPLLDWTNTELSWLAAHGPEPCYRDLYQTVQQEITAEHAAVVDALNGAEGSDSALQDQGIQELLATQQFEAALTTTTGSAATSCLGG